MILTASNYRGARHPSWSYYNLIAHPECGLHIGPRGGRSWRVEIEGAERERLFSLAVGITPATPTMCSGPTASGRSGCSG